MYQVMVVYTYLLYLALASTLIAGVIFGLLLASWWREELCPWCGLPRDLTTGQRAGLEEGSHDRQ